MAPSEASHGGAPAGRPRNPPAILLGGGITAVPVARSLGRADVPVYALGHESDPVRWSRHCTQFVDVGAGPASQARMLAWLEGGPRRGVVLPCNDDSLELLLGHRATLERLGYVLIEAPDEVLGAMLDKERTYELARAADIPAPRTLTLRSEREVDVVAREIGFPCALKPLYSHHFKHHFGAETKVILAREQAELEEAIARVFELGIPVLATEIVPGDDDQFCSYCTYIDESGEPLFHFTKRKLRQNPPRFGIGCYHVTDWSPKVAELGLRFFQGVGLRGFAYVEFKRDGRDGRLVLIECNYRFSAATELPRAAGLDLPLFTYNRLLGRPTPPVDSYRHGLHLWLAAEDTRAFLGYRRAGELTFARWARSLLRPQRLPIASVVDPLPALGAVMYKLRRRGRAIFRPGQAKTEQ